MKSNKLKSIVAMATMTSIVSMASTGYTSSNKVNNKIKETTMLTNTSGTTKISPSDLQVNVTNVNISKTALGASSNTDKYIPENNVPATGNIATTGTVITYKISVSLRSKSGKLYNISKCYLSANPTAKYVTNGKPETPQEKQAITNMLDSLNVNLQNLTNLDSTSTFTITASFKIGEADWDVNMIPNIDLHIDVNGSTKTIPINVPDIKLTKHYLNYVAPNVKVTPDESKPHIQYVSLNFNNNTLNNNSGVYNVNNSKPSSITFKIYTQGQNFTITPLDVPGLVSNPNGTYTISGKLMDGVQKLFKITTNTDNRFVQPIYVTPVNETFNSPSGVDATAATTNQYEVGKANVIQNELITKGNPINMQQFSTTESSDLSNMSSFDNVFFGTTIDAGLKGTYDVLTGSLITNGQVLFSDFGKIISAYTQNAQCYYNLNQNTVDILKSGTAEQKEQILWKIATGEMNGIGTMYTANEISEMMSNGQPLPSVNFVVAAGVYDSKSNLKITGNYITAPTGGVNNRVISRTYTLGILVGKYSNTELSTMQSQIEQGKAKQDGVLIRDGKFAGFMMSPPNNYTDEVINSNYISQITDTRYTGYSHGISSGAVMAHDYTGVSVDNPFGGSSQNTIEKVGVSWLDKPHMFNAQVTGFGSGPQLTFTNKSQMVINMGAPFKLIGGVQLMWDNLSPSDYKIDGDKLIVNIPEGWEVNLSDSPNVTFNAQYINPDKINNLDISAKMVGPDGHQGLEYNYNDIANHSVVAGGLPPQTIYHTKIDIIRAAKTDCMHSSTPLNSNNETTLTDMIHNEDSITKQYMIVGEIPVNGSDNLPGQDGAVSQGGLNTTLETLDTNGVPTWVLPKSALNSTNRELLESPDANKLNGEMSYIENPKSGWIKYVPGQTNLSDIVGYVATPTVQGGQDFTMQYKVKLGGIQKGKYQLINSAFKYYDMTDDIGSTSNVVTITPPCENLNYTWISGVVTPTGVLTKQELTKNVDGHSLQELFGHGPDNDGSWDLTPKALQSKVDLATNAEEMKELGYKLDEIEVNGKVVTPDWFKTVGILQNSGITHIKFVISKLPEQPVQKYTDTVKVVDENNQPVIPEVSVTGVSGTDTGLKAPKIPEGYHIVNVTDNNKTIEPGVPSKFTNDDQNIVYHIAKNPITTVEEFYPNGKPVVANKTTTNLEGAKVDTAIPDLPNGYQITKITVNGKEVSQNEVPTVQSKDNQTIVYTIDKMPTDTVKVIDNKGNEVVPSVSKTGKIGSNTGLNIPDIPKGYHIVNITNGNGEKVTGVPSTFGNSDN
ncbi:MucBP domain-containing protein, partial [Clostridium mediterraneense]|uniref:MucBP domain-containing protein n=1 Tax=Clostridium mediterraneense TaxID=1805472 RepID=UPI00135630CE